MILDLDLFVIARQNPRLLHSVSRDAVDVNAEATGIDHQNHSPASPSLRLTASDPPARHPSLNSHLIMFPIVFSPFLKQAALPTY